MAGLSLVSECHQVSSGLQNSIINMIPREFFFFFTTASAVGLSLEYELQQLSANLQDSSQYFD